MPGNTGLASGPDVTIAIDLGGGDDSLDVGDALSGQYGALVVRGGAGDDFLGFHSATTSRDQIFGDAGDDAIDTFSPGGAAEFGGDGNDSFRMDLFGPASAAGQVAGDAGVDELLVVPGDSSNQVAIRPAASPRHVSVHAVFPEPGSPADDVDVSTFEHVTVHEFAGSSTIIGAPGLAALLPDGMQLDGSLNGDDHITGATRPTRSTAAAGTTRWGRAWRGRDRRGSRQRRARRPRAAREETQALIPRALGSVSLPPL